MWFSWLGALLDLLSVAIDWNCCLADLTTRWRWPLRSKVLWVNRFADGNEEVENLRSRTAQHPVSYWLRELRYSPPIGRFFSSSVFYWFYCLNDIHGSKRGCHGSWIILTDKRFQVNSCAWVPDYQEHVEDDVQNKTTFIVVTITVIFLLEVMVKRKTCVFQRKLTEEEETEGGRVRWCELAWVGRGEEGGGWGGGEEEVMAKDEGAEAGEEEKEEREKYQCEHCGKSYVF